MIASNIKLLASSIQATKPVRVKVTVRKKGVIVRKYVKRKSHLRVDMLIEFIGNSEEYLTGDFIHFEKIEGVFRVIYRVSIDEVGMRYKVKNANTKMDILSLPLVEKQMTTLIGRSQPERSTSPFPTKPIDPHIESDEFVRETFGANPDKAPFESSDFPEGGTPLFNKEILQKRIDELEKWHGNENYTRRFDGKMILKTVTYTKFGNFYTCKVWNNNELVASKNHHFDNMLDAQKYCDSLPVF